MARTFYKTTHIHGQIGADLAAAINADYADTLDAYEGESSIDGEPDIRYQAESVEGQMRYSALIVYYEVVEAP